jgi:hypothetical protein
MGGSAEILSADLVHHVASLSYEKRREIEIVNHEDITIGNFVLSHPQKVTRVDLGQPWGYKVRRRRLNVPILWRHDKKTKQPGKLLAKWMIYEREIRREDKDHKNIMVLPTSKNSESLIKSAIKSGCIHYKKSLVEYCATEHFAGKKELYLSRSVTDIMLFGSIDPNSTLMFERGNWDKKVDPGDGSNQANNDDEDDDEDEEEDDNNAVQEEDTEDAPTDSVKQPWTEIVLVALQNPINEHLRDWLNVLLPNQPFNEFSVTSNNQDALTQLRMTNYAKVFAVRMENLWEDVVGLEKILGNPRPVDPAEWPALSDPAVKMLTNMGHGEYISTKLCCQLRHEIVAYFNLLALADNLKHNPSVERSVKETFSMCGITSFGELDRKC